MRNKIYQIILKLQPCCYIALCITNAHFGEHDGVPTATDTFKLPWNMSKYKIIILC